MSDWSGTIAQLNCNTSLNAVAGADNIPTLADVARVFGNSVAVKIITEHLQSVLRYAEVELADSQLAETALSILSSYWFLNLAELCIFFSQLKNGSRGQFVWGTKVNNQAIMVALNSFRIDRMYAIIKSETEAIRVKAQKNYSRIENFASALVNGVDNIRKLNKKAKCDYSEFRRLFPQLPDNYNPKELWMAFSGNEDAIRAIYGTDNPLPDNASDDIYGFLCEYNIRHQK